jgi:hypothetical protein
VSIPVAAALQAEVIHVEVDLAFTADRDVFLAAVARVKEALPARTPMPVLTGIHIHARPNGTVRLRASDLERDVETTMPADVATPGIALPAGAPLAQLLARAPKVALHCSSDGRQVSLAWSAANFHLPVFKSEVYPEPPAVEATDAATLPGATLSALAEAAFAASADTGRPVLQAVRLRDAARAERSRRGLKGSQPIAVERLGEMLACHRTARRQHPMPPLPATLRLSPKSRQRLTTIRVAVYGRLTSRSG